jgi:hypothetical protein
MAMSQSMSAQKAQATHDAAMSIIEKEARDRAAKTEHLRQLRLAAEAQAEKAGHGEKPSVSSLPKKVGRPARVKKAS